MNAPSNTVPSKDSALDRSGTAIGRDTSHSVRLTRLAVSLLVLWALLDIGGRLLPVDWLHVLPEHIATRRPGRYADGRLEPMTWRRGWEWKLFAANEA